MTPTKAEELAADTLETWTANYSLHLSPHALHAFWSSGAPAACALALKAAVAELRRLDHNNRVLTDALWKACGDDEETVNATIESQGELK